MDRRDKRTQMLATNYDMIRERVKGAMKSCATLDKSVIDKYISKILSVNQEDSVQTINVSQLLYNHFADIYPVEIVWVFYTAWNYDAVDGDKYAGRYAQSYNIVYNGDCD